MPAGWGWRVSPPAFGAGLHCRMAAMPYPAYGVRTSGFRRWPALPDGGDALSGLRSAPAAFGAGLFCRMAAMPYPAYKFCRMAAGPYPAYKVRRRHAR